jgi:hypothetical protein
LNDDGTDLGPDIDAIAQATSGTIAGTPPWQTTAGLQITLGSSTAIVTLQGRSPWALTLFNRPARIAANRVAIVPDTCAAGIVDGVRRQIVVSGLTPGATYYYSATDGVRTLVGQIAMLAPGSGTYNFNFSGNGVRYSSSVDMSGATPAAGGVVPVASQSVVYADHGAGTSIVALVAQ